MATVRITGNDRMSDEELAEGAASTTAQMAIFFDNSFPNGKNAVYRALLRIKEKLIRQHATR